MNADQWKFSCTTLPTNMACCNHLCMCCRVYVCRVCSLYFYLFYNCTFSVCRLFSLHVFLCLANFLVMKKQPNSQILDFTDFDVLLNIFLHFVEQAPWCPSLVSLRSFWFQLVPLLCNNIEPYPEELGPELSNHKYIGKPPLVHNAESFITVCNRGCTRCCLAELCNVNVCLRQKKCLFEQL